MHLDSFVVSALLLLTATALSVALFRQLGLGSVLGLLVAGILVGPHSPGPQVTSQVEEVRHFAELGVVFLLFVIGLEMKPDRLWSMRRELFGMGTLQILLTGVVLAGYVMLGGYSLGIALLMGFTLALSSTAFIMQLLAERGEMASRHGSGSFAILLMQDLAVVPLLALVPLLARQGDLSATTPWPQKLLILVAMFAVLWLFGMRLVPSALDWLARNDNREGFWLLVLLSIIFAAWAMHQVGLSMALGAFVLGMLLSSSRYNLQIRALVEPYKGLLMALFFVAVGMSLDLEALIAQPLVFFGQTLILIAIKLVVLIPLALLFGYRAADAVRIGFYLGQAGEFGFVLFGAAQVMGVIDDKTFVLAIGVISVSMLLTPLLVQAGERIANRLSDPVKHDRAGTPGGLEPPKRFVVIGGYGRVGHTVGTLLEVSGIDYIAVDKDPERVSAGLVENKKVFYGDLSDSHLLSAIHMERAALVVLTLDNPKKSFEAVSLIRTQFPGVPVIARARDLKASTELIRAGANQAYPETLEASLRLGATALEMVGAPGEDVGRLLDGIRQGNYTLIKTPAPRAIDPET